MTFANEQTRLLYRQLAQNPWLASIDQTLAMKLINAGQLKSYAEGAVIHARDAKGDGLYCVVTGRIRASNFTVEGKEMVLTWLMPGSWFGEISLLDSLPRTHQTTAEQDSKLLHVSNSAYKVLVTESPDIERIFIPLLCQRIRSLFSILEDAGTLTLKQQLVKRLLFLASELGNKSGDEPAILEVSQESLAMMLSTSRQSINKWLNELRDEGFIELQYGSIVIPNSETLSRYVKQ